MTDRPLPIAEVSAWARSPSCGASVVFTGSVRDHSPGRPGVACLRYEAYRGWVEPGWPRWSPPPWPVGRRWAGSRPCTVWASFESVTRRWVAAVASPHRREAFEAASFAIDTLKATVPIWKHETWDGGEGWVSREYPPDDASPVG